MKFIVRLHAEITIKSNSVRKRFTRLLESNIRNVFRPYPFDVGVTNQWDKLMVNIKTEDPELIEQARLQLSRIPGIEYFAQIRQSTFKDKDDVFQQVLPLWKDKLAGKTFAVRVRRKGKQNFSSTELAAYVGGGLNQHCQSAGVKLKNPDVTIAIEVEDDQLIQIVQRTKGLGGFPIPTQGQVLSLMSGGFDSGVASYHMIRRGTRTHYVFFNLGGREHEIGVREVSHYLWKRYGTSHRVKFIAVDFAPVVQMILEQVENGLMGVMLKRMMLRAAAIVAENLGIDALATGESMGQVSSQTLANLNVIDQVTNKLVLRPLICADKQEIIDTARQIGTEDFARVMPEYCGVISNKPTVAAPLQRVEEIEAQLDLTVIDKLVKQANVEDIRSILDKTEEKLVEVESVTEVGNAVILDVRAPVEQERLPLEEVTAEVILMPFYQLASKFGDLPQDKHYLLYCQRGVMSKLQALYLQEQGFTNVAVYHPESR